jgi:hypothetical protein
LRRPVVGEAEVSRDLVARAILEVGTEERGGDFTRWAVEGMAA